jgi:hypothetical protein
LWLRVVGQVELDTEEAVALAVIEQEPGFLFLLELIIPLPLVEEVLVPLRPHHQMELAVQVVLTQYFQQLRLLVVGVVEPEALQLLMDYRVVQAVEALLVDQHPQAPLLALVALETLPQQAHLKVPMVVMVKLALSI